MASRVDLLNEIFSSSLGGMCAAIDLHDTVLGHLTEFEELTDIDYSKETSELFKMRNKLVDLHDRIANKWPSGKRICRYT